MHARIPVGEPGVAQLADRTLPQFAGGSSPSVPCTCANGYEKQHPVPSQPLPWSEANDGCWTDAGFNYNSFEHNLERIPGNTTVRTGAAPWQTAPSSHCTRAIAISSLPLRAHSANGRRLGGTGARPRAPRPDRAL